MKNKKIIELYNGLLELNGLSGVKFSYAISKNIKILEVEIEVLKNLIKPSEDFNKYNKERVDLCIKYSFKNTHGEPETIKNIDGSSTYKIENQEIFDKEFNVLKETYKETLELREKQLKDFEDFLEIDTKIELYKIDIKDVPENIKTEQMNIIYPLIKE